MRSSAHALAAVVAAVVAVAAEASPPGGGIASASVPDDRRVERILELGYTEVESVRLVLLPANVEDRKGRLVRGLTRDDFRLFEEQVPQAIRYFAVEDRQPVEIAFLLDVSGSMRLAGQLEEAKEAIRFFGDDLRPEDRLALICFADEQVAWVTEFTADRARFLERLMVQEGYGQTALHDAVAAAPGLVAAATTGRKAIVLVTDGVDNASRLTTAQAAELARQASVPIYTIGFTTTPRELLRRGETVPRLQALATFSEETGGQLFQVHDPDDLKEAVARIAEELRYQYLIGYTPTRPALDGTYRRVRLESSKRGLEIRTRAGYYAAP